MALVKLLVKTVASSDQPEASSTFLAPSEVAGLAAQLLRMLLALYGALEASGAFNRLSRGRYEHICVLECDVQ